MMTTGTGAATVAAVATPAGAGGIGVIRVSGPKASSILRRIFRAAKKNADESLPSHLLVYGHIKDPETDETVDEVLAVYMRAPRTYTREDVVEIHCHGSHAVLSRILSLVLQAGAGAAPPGEFTRRAFMNGRIDLAQAESVLELIQADTNRARTLALSGLTGGLAQALVPIRDVLVETRARLEVAIDFPEEDLEIVAPEHTAARLRQEAALPLADLIRAAEQGMIFRQGATVVLAGRPNVGKSSLLNILLGQDRALVTPHAGTTRDTVEEWMDLDGLAVRLVDTAGIHENPDAIEGLGIRRAREKIGAADLVLFLLDASRPLQREELDCALELADKNVLLVANKIDCALPGAVASLAAAAPGLELVEISAKTATNIPALGKAIFRRLTGRNAALPPDPGVCPNSRQKDALVRALAAVQRSIAAMAAGTPPVLVAVDLGEALAALEESIGGGAGTDVLDQIFARFCIGK